VRRLIEPRLGIGERPPDRSSESAGLRHALRHDFPLPTSTLDAAHDAGPGRAGAEQPAPIEPEPHLWIWRSTARLDGPTATVADVSTAEHAATPVLLCPDDGSTPTERSKADQFVRKVLFVKERPAHVSKRAAETAFQKSMLISATRCTLTYIVFPFVLPAFGIVTSVGPALGIIIGVVALISDVFSIRRFFAADHRWRWHFSAIALCVISLLTVLLVQDIVHAAG
jgi:hypothetical protein